LGVKTDETLELNVDFQRVCLGRALEDVVCFLYLFEFEICEDVHSDCQLTITKSILARLDDGASNVALNLPCVTISAAVSSLPTDIKSRMRGIVCVLTRPIESAVDEKKNKMVSKSPTPP
jgi:hypothetical protein